MPRPPLTVRRVPTGYVLHDPALARLAGIDAVPLPFTALAPPATVVAHLRRLSPHRTVRFDRQSDTGDQPNTGGQPGAGAAPSPASRPPSPCG